MQVILWLKVLH